MVFPDVIGCCRVAVCCWVLQCLDDGWWIGFVAVCCRVLQGVAECCRITGDCSELDDGW